MVAVDVTVVVGLDGPFEFENTVEKVEVPILGTGEGRWLYGGCGGFTNDANTRGMG